MIEVAKRLVFTMSVLVLLYLGYAVEASYFKFMPSSLGILVLSLIFYGKSGFKIIGLDASLRFYTVAVAIATSLAFISHEIIHWVLAASSAAIQNEKYDHILVNIFQALNEEIVFRAILLLFLLRVFSSGELKSLVGILVIPAIVFSGFHWLFFGYLIKPEHQGLLIPSVYITLFFFGVATNAFYLAYRNILIPWAIHYSWHVSRYAFELEGSLGERLLEYKGFNILEGSWQVCILSAFLATIGIFVLWRNRLIHPPEGG